MKWFYWLVCLILVFSFKIYSPLSAVWIPPNYQQVYEDSIHIYDGTLGPNYWQNHTEYDIQVDVAPSTRMLSGQETITYYNAIPDTLHEIVLRLYQDIYKRGSPRDFPMPDSSLHDGIALMGFDLDRHSAWVNLEEGVLCCPAEIMDAVIVNGVIFRYPQAYLQNQRQKILKAKVKYS